MAIGTQWENLRITCECPLMRTRHKGDIPQPRRQNGLHVWHSGPMNGCGGLDGGCAQVCK